MSSSDELFDIGLQPERTLLAWRRTCLALAAAILVIVKVLAALSSAWSYVLGVVGLALPALAWLLASRRYRQAHLGLTRAGDEQRLPAGGPAVAVATAGTLLVGALAMWFVLS